ncbi:MAG TPA: chromate transporter [Trueperaceae bacterium]
MLAETLRLLWSFTKVGLFGFGGGPSMIPLIQEEVVEINRWLTPEEFLDAFALGNALPGPIATKMAGYVGYKIAGPVGAAVSLIGLTAPTIVAIVLLFTAYLRFRDVPAIGGFLRGVRPVVIALLAIVVWQFAPSAFGAPATWLNNWPLWLIALAAFVLTLRFDVHPIYLIVAGGALGIFFLRP